MYGLMQKALVDEDLAYAIVGQALLDEGSILTSNIEIFYNDEKKEIVASLSTKPKTSRELAYELGLSGSTIKGHLHDLRRAGKVRIIGKNTRSIKGKRKCAYVWESVPSR